MAEIGVTIATVQNPTLRGAALAHLEGLLEGLREAITGRAPAS